LINFNLDHFTNLVGNLHLFAFKSVNFVPHCIAYLSNLTSGSHFQTCTGHFFLFDPTVNTSNLRFEIGLKCCNSLVFTLELCPNDGIHLVITVPQFFCLVATLLLAQFVFNVDLVLDVVELAGSFLLLTEQTVDEVSHFNLHSISQFGVNLPKHASELFRIFKVRDFNTAKILFFFHSFHFDQAELLLKCHDFLLHFLVYIA
jgi:hypothetical protein